MHASTAIHTRTHHIFVHYQLQGAVVVDHLIVHTVRQANGMFLNAGVGHVKHMNIK